MARPPSRLYELQKTVRRHKFGFAAAAALVTALAVGVGVSTWQAVRATRAKRMALAAEAQATTQRERAEASEQKALAAQANETKLRQQAETEELAARQRAYASDMNVAKQALAGSNLGRALDLLNRQRPQPGQKDLRGWEWRYLWQQTRSDALFTLCQEPAEIYSLAVSPDGNWLGIGSLHKNGLSVWDLRMWQELVRLAAKESFVCAAFSPTDPLLAFTSCATSASGPERNALRLWNTVTRQLVAELPLEAGNMGLAFAQDGRTLVTSTRGGRITLWRMPAGTKLGEYASEQAGFNALSGFAAAPDLSLAVYGLPQGRIRAIDLRDGKELWTAVAAKEFITALAFSPDGKTLASAAGFTESDILLWDVATGKQIGQLEGHGSWVSALVFWPDGKKLASSSADQTIRTWDLASQKCLEVLRGHRLEVWRLSLLPDHKTLVSGGKDGTVCLWDTSARQPHPPRSALPTKNLVNANFAPDGRSILTLNQQGEVLQWAGTGFQSQERLLEAGANILSSCFSPEGRFLAVNRTNGILQVWDVAQRVLLHQLTNAPGNVLAQILVPDGKRLITWSEHDNLLHEWDLTTGLERQSWRAPEAYNGVELSPDGRQCVSFGREGGVLLRNLADRNQRDLSLDVLEGDMGRYSPNGKLFAVPSSLGYTRVWDVASWRQVASLGGLLKGAHSVCFSADGKRLAVGSGDQEAVKLWDTESWQDVFTLEGQGTGYIGTWFSPDGNTIAWGNQTGALYFWRAPSWEEIAAAEVKEKPEIKQP